MSKIQLKVTPLAVTPLGKLFMTIHIVFGTLTLFPLGRDAFYPLDSISHDKAWREQVYYSAVSFSTKWKE